MNRAPGCAAFTAGPYPSDEAFMRHRTPGRVVRGFVASLAPAQAGSAFAPAWPQFRFDEAHTGYNRFEQALAAGNVGSLGLAWQAQLGRLVNDSSPAVAGDLVYIASSDGTLW